ncbi:MAG: hypothetical protein K0U13_04175 [Chlamydiae bacterium]|nr:hypothetical protein [Chlamydiota bacterium]
MEFYDQNLSKFSCYMGHQFYCYIGPASHASEFLFVPNRQKDQITSITLYHKETGKSLSMAELQKGVKKYCENWRGQESEPAAHYPKEAIRDEEWKRGQGERKPLLSGSQQAAGVVSAQPTQVQVTVGDFVFTQITLTEDE